MYAGKVGDEYFMTKGHFHTILDTSEVYYCLSGRGAMLMETPEGDVRLVEMKPGEAVYVPPRWAHRSINTGSETLVTFFVFRSDAGHDYGTIEQKGYRKLVVERDGQARDDRQSSLGGMSWQRAESDIAGSARSVSGICGARRAPAAERKNTNRLSGVGIFAPPRLLCARSGPRNGGPP